MSNYDIEVPHSKEIIKSILTRIYKTVSKNAAFITSYVHALFYSQGINMKHNSWDIQCARVHRIKANASATLLPDD